MCGCRSDGEPEWTDSPGPLLPSVSVSFSKDAVIFEEAYENEPGKLVGKQSTRTRLNLVATGGPDGGTLTVTPTNLAKLERISGPGLPLGPVIVPPETQVSYSIVYEGAEASDAADDVAVAASVWCETNECPGVAGNFVGYFDVAVLPTNVSFQAILTAELGYVATNAVGFFALPEHVGLLDHSVHGANNWHGVGRGNCFSEGNKSRISSYGGSKMNGVLKKKSRGIS